MTPARLALAPAPVPTLAEQINHHHEQACASFRRTTEHAVQAGELLHQAKLELDHGDWTLWLSEHFAGSHRVAQRYMQLAEAARHTPKVLEPLLDESITAALKAIAIPAPKPPAIPAGGSEPAEPAYELTAGQLLDLVAAFGGQTTEAKILRWVQRLTEPKMTFCADCHTPVLQAVVKGETVLAEQESWLERGRCTKCLQTRNAHPGSYVNCEWCGDTGWTGQARRPPSRMLAIDMAWDDDERIHLRVIGPSTDRRRGEALHAIHRCCEAGEQAA